MKKKKKRIYVFIETISFLEKAPFSFLWFLKKKLTLTRNAYVFKLLPE